MAPAVVDLNAELAEIVIADPSSGEEVNVNSQLLLRYLSDPNGLALVKDRTWNALRERDWSSDEQQAAVTQEWFRLLDDIAQILISRDRIEGRGHSPNTSARTFFKGVVEHHRPALFRVGTVELGKFLAVEPQILEVQDDYDVRRIGSLRSDTDAVIKGKRPRSEIRVELDIPDIKTINLVLRDLVAQCRVAPIIPVESDILTDILLNYYATPDQMQEMVFQYWDQQQNHEPRGPSEAILERIDTFEELKTALQEDDTIELYHVFKTRYDWDKKHGVRSRHMAQPKQDRDYPAYGLRFGMVLTGLSMATIPQSNHAIRVTLTFQRANDNAFNIAGLAFRDANGNRTFDLKHCPYFHKYYHLAYLEGEAPEPSDVLIHESSTATSRTNTNKKKSTPNPWVMTEINQEELQFNCPIEFAWVGTQTKVIKEWSLHKEPVVLKDLQANWNNKVALIPIVGQSHPIVQHLGSSNLVARLQFATTDRDLVNKFHAMKDELDETRRNVENMDRYERVYVRNGLLNSLGSYSFVIGNVTTQTDPKTKDLVYITITLIESKYGIMERETPILKREVVAQQHLRDFFLQALVPAFESAVRKIRRAGVGFPEGSIPLPLDVHERLAFGLMTGNKIIAEVEKVIADNDTIEYSLLDKPHGVLNGRLFNAAVSRHFSPILDNSTNVRSLYNSDVIPWVGGDYPLDPQKYGDTPEPTGLTPYDVVNSLFEFFTPNAYENAPRPTRKVTRGGSGGFGSRFKVSPQRSARTVTEYITSSEIDADESPALQIGRVLKLARAMHDIAPGRWESNGHTWPPGYKEWYQYLMSVENQTSKPAVDPVAGAFLRIILGPGLPIVEPRFWEDIIDTILDRPADQADNPAWVSDDLDRSYILLRATLQQGLDERFPGFDSGKYRVETRNISLDPTNPEAKLRDTHNYPDLHLPTYEQLFSDGKDNKGQYKLIEYEGEPVGGHRWRDRQAWRLFAPRYADLGVEPPFNERVGLSTMWEAQQQLARDQSDTVEPAFFYYPHSIKDTQEAFLSYEQEYEQLLNEQDEGAVVHLSWANAAEGGVVSPAQGGDPAATMKEIQQKSKIHEHVDILFKEASKFPDNRIDYPDGFRNAKRAISKVKGFNSGEYKKITFVDSVGTPIMAKEHLGKGGVKTYRFKYNFLLGEKRSIRSPWNTEQWEFDVGTRPGVMDNLIGHMPDNHMSMARAYPTYRLYFIEEDRQQFIYSDDFYGVNCVSSIEIRHSKADASLAVIRLTNVSRNFEFDTMLSPDEMDALKINPDDEDGEPIFRFFKFRSGTLVQIRMGYTSNPDELPIVFTGKIVEVQTGQVITLTCQGHRSELLNEIEYARSSKNFHQILDECFRKINPPHLGRAMKLNQYSEHFALETLGRKSVMDIPWWAAFLHMEVNNYTRNVYLHSSAPPEYEFWPELVKGNFLNATKDAGEGITRVWGIRWFLGLFNKFSKDTLWDNWIIPLQPFYNAIQEMARHQPGTVAYVLPFEQDATLFFGSPSQPYLARNPSISERQTYNKLARIVGQKDLKEGPGKTLAEFLSSDRYATRTLLETADAGSGRNFVAYLNRVKDIGTPIYKFGTNRDITGVFHSMLDAYALILEDTYVTAGVYMVKVPVAADPWSSDNETPWAIYTFDWTDSWDYFKNEDPELLRFVWSYVMEWDPRISPWPGGLEGKWETMARGLMGALVDSDGDPTPEAEDWKDSFGEVFADNVLKHVQKSVLIGEDEDGNLARTSLHADPTNDVWNLDNPHPDYIAKKVGEVFKAGHISVDTFNDLMEDLLTTSTFPIEGTSLKMEVGAGDLNDTNSSRELTEHERDTLLEMHQARTDAQMKGLIAGLGEAVDEGRISFEISEQIVLEKTNENIDALEQIKGLTHIQYVVDPSKTFPLQRDVAPTRNLQYWLKKGDSSYILRRVDRIRELLRKVRHGGKDPTGINFITSRTGQFRLFLKYLHTWHQELGADSNVKKDARAGRTRTLMQKTRAFAMPPGYKVFRDYHLISSRSDIIDNQIVASMREMHNTITIRRPTEKITYMIDGEEEQTAPDPSTNPTEKSPIVLSQSMGWQSFPINEGIPLHPRIGKEYRKLLVKVENNAVGETQAARCLLSNAGLMVEPMYRGHLSVVGRPMKPHDVINLSDEWNDMTGPFEVDEVVHHFTPQTGWITNITPNTLVHVNDRPSRVQLSGWQWWLNRTLDFYNEYWLYIEIGMFLASAGLGNVALAGVRQAAKSGGRFLLKAMAAKGARLGAQKGARATVGRFLTWAGRDGGMTTARALAARNPAGFWGGAARFIIPPGLLRTLFKVSGRGTYLFGPLMNTTWIRMNTGLTQIPVDMAVLMHKSRPYTAGLEYGLVDVLSWSDRWSGFWNELFGLAETAAFKPDLAILDTEGGPS